MARRDIERQVELEPKRIKFTSNLIIDLGYEIIYSDNTKLQFIFKGEKVTLFAYSGWHTGKSIKDGRVLHKLINQLK